MLAGLSSIIYIVLTYMEDGHQHLRDWFNASDKIICFIILSLQLIKVYVSQHRQNEIFTFASMISMSVSIPILVIPSE